jgi:hypothetical protein
MTDTAPCSTVVACSGLPFTPQVPAECKLLAAGGAPRNATCRTPGDNVTYAAIFMQSGLGEPGFAVWKAGTWTIRLKVLLGNSSYRWRDLYLCRMNLACASIATIGERHGAPIATLTSGTYTTTIVVGADHLGSVSDTIYLVFGIRQTPGPNNIITLRFDQVVDTPLEFVAPPSVMVGHPVLQTARGFLGGHGSGDRADLDRAALRADAAAARAQARLAAMGGVLLGQGTGAGARCDAAKGRLEAHGVRGAGQAGPVEGDADAQGAR